MVLLCTNLCTFLHAIPHGSQRIMPSNVYNRFRVHSFTLFPSEVSRCGAEATLDAGHGLHLAMGYIVGQLLIRGADGIVTDAGKLADADVVVRLEVLIQCIGQFGRCEGLAHLSLHLKLHVGIREWSIVPKQCGTKTS